MTHSQTDTCLANPKSLCYTGSMLDQHLRRRPSTDATCAYGNVLRLPGSYRPRLKHKALNQCWPNMRPASQMLHHIRTTSRLDITYSPVTLILYPG